MNKRYIDLTNQKFGKLMVIEFVGINNDRRPLWKCECDCGNKVIVSGKSMKSGHTLSCGCLRKSHIRSINKSKRKYEESTDNYEYYRHREGAKNRNLTPLAKEDWQKIVIQPCYYCGRIDMRSFLNSNKNINRVYLEDEITRYDKKLNGIDRVDSSKNYTLENSIPCCKMCNWMKNSFSQKDFINKVKEIYKNLDLDKS